MQGVFTVFSYLVHFLVFFSNYGTLMLAAIRVLTEQQPIEENYKMFKYCMNNHSVCVIRSIKSETNYHKNVCRTVYNMQVNCLAYRYFVKFYSQI